MNKPNITLALIAFTFLSFAISGCKKDEPEDVISDDQNNITPTVFAGDSTHAELLAAFSQMPDTAIAPEEMQLSNGHYVDDILVEWDPDFFNQYRSPHGTQSLQFPAPYQKDIFLAHMLLVANYLCDDARHTVAADSVLNAPQQIGLAYSFGSKDWSVRQSPSDLTQGVSTCNQPIYGLDCSGMMMSMLRFMGMQLCSECTDVSHQKDAFQWDNMFTQSVSYDSLRMEDLGDLPLAQLETGDIIVWYSNAGKHIGIILEHQGAQYIYNSIGRPSACDLNLDSEHGPRTYRLTQNALDINAGQRRVLRIKTLHDCTSVTDIDGNVYPVVTIGERCWMAENLRTTHYTNGEAIQSSEDPLTFLTFEEGAFTYPGSMENIADFGLMYNYYSVIDSRNVCPAGWRIPTQLDWLELELALGLSPDDPNLLQGGVERGIDANVGGKLKSNVNIEVAGGPGFWYTPNVGATNSSGFDARGAAYVTSVLGDYNIGWEADFWTADSVDAGWAYARTLLPNSAGIYISTFDHHGGISIRCISE